MLMRNSMKCLTWCLASFAFVALAQTNTNTIPVHGGSPAPDTGFGLLLTLIPLVVPLVVAALKTAVSKLPSWSLPIIATALGAALNYILALTNQPHTNLLYGALLGAAGVGVREIYDQVKGTVQTQQPPATT